MISAKGFVKQFVKNGVTRFTGVPDSVLKPLCNYLSSNSGSFENTIVANEGSAIAVATGHFLSTGRPSLVYFQNSGLGNALNPLVSLTHPNVYGIPAILLIGWRGEPGVKDEPQHIEQGSITPRILESLGIPWFVLPTDDTSLPSFLSKVFESMRLAGGPVAILARPATFNDLEINECATTGFEFTREKAISAVVDSLPSRSVVVCTTGMASRELYEHRMATSGEINRDFLMVGAMGHASSVAHAIASIKRDLLVCCIDGDGALLMHMGAVAVIGMSKTSNLVHVLINNAAHDSVGGQPIAAENLDMLELALACGYRKAIRVNSAQEIERLLESKLLNDGPTFIDVKVSKGSRKDLGRPKTSPKQNKENFIKYMKKIDLSNE
jgi:phosphonopyruvate decarboxylase